jgi:hypothetical protein
MATKMGHIPQNMFMQTAQASKDATMAYFSLKILIKVIYY